MENNAYSLSGTKARLHFSLQFLYCEGKSFFKLLCKKQKKKKEAQVKLWPHFPKARSF